MSRKIAGIIAAGGTSSRFGSDKLELKLDNKPIIAYSTQVLANHKSIERVVVACSDVDRTKKLLDGFVGNNVEFLEGGASRAESVRNAMGLLIDYDLVFVHDAARPFTTGAIVDRLQEEIQNYSCTVPVFPINGAVKGVAPNMAIDEHIRGRYWEAQTPQLVWVEPLVYVQKKHNNDLSKYADESMMMADNGFSVFGVRGERLNFKLTEPEDELLARVISSYSKRK
ncbi:MAG TPA: IspD/TarI family cytidylyltransferase [Caldisericia bacterium]|nr:IspD/TarI family cytidylyltransferase [Caldisericia bacterium]HPF48784.1 IspD/TarI family cytidylyltransferase [Caldisericia bacterium]HPI83556.1 IspD/TarI family cytidylyltransferase [Caldisericia bacterium]HPQ93239.1 IspD/TarI family cytidylyltransferase [Caldisericia bacterium]HRV74928.1 IspD/TarI family cytidylyltransferase [Caldisericia bacterium]